MSVVASREKIVIDLKGEDQEFPELRLGYHANF
jgi:hypothetical protein